MTYTAVSDPQRMLGTDTFRYQATQLDSIMERGETEGHRVHYTQSVAQGTEHGPDQGPVGQSKDLTKAQGTEHSPDQGPGDGAQA